MDYIFKKVYIELGHTNDTRDGKSRPEDELSLSNEEQASVSQHSNILALF